MSEPPGYENIAVVQQQRAVMRSQSVKAASQTQTPTPTRAPASGDAASPSSMRRATSVQSEYLLSFSGLIDPATPLSYENVQPLVLPAQVAFPVLLLLSSECDDPRRMSSQSSTPRRRSALLGTHTRRFPRTTFPSRRQSMRIRPLSRSQPKEMTYPLMRPQPFSPLAQARLVHQSHRQQQPRHPLSRSVLIFPCDTHDRRSRFVQSLVHLLRLHQLLSRKTGDEQPPRLPLTR
jgi:hypothetical protein